jgi:CRP-like cAMP-binding protein
MEQASLIQFLTHTHIISPQKAVEIAAGFTEKEITKQEYLLREGKVANEYLFLEQGCLRAFAHDVDGKEVTTGLYTHRQMVFEVSSFFNRIPSRENIQAITDSKGWYISFEQLNNYFHSLPEFREFGRSILVHGYSNLKTRMLSMITETAEARYEDLLRSNPDVFQHVPLKHIASYLGITDTSLSRIRKEFAKK